MDVKLTEFQIKTLTKINDEPGITARRLGEYLWPDSVAHRRSYNVGNNGAATGVGGWLSAGSYVGKLRKKGWVDYKIVRIWDRKREMITYELRGYELTREGERILEPYLEESHT